MGPFLIKGRFTSVERIYKYFLYLTPFADYALSYIGFIRVYAKSENEGDGNHLIGWRKKIYVILPIIYLNPTGQKVSLEILILSKIMDSCRK